MVPVFLHREKRVGGKVGGKNNVEKACRCECMLGFLRRMGISLGMKLRDKGRKEGGSRQQGL